MENVLSSAELKRRGIAAIEEGLQRGAIQLLKHNRPAAVVLSPDEYQRLLEQGRPVQPGLTAVDWLLAQKSLGNRSRVEIDEALREERDW